MKKGGVGPIYTRVKKVGRFYTKVKNAEIGPFYTKVKKKVEIDPFYIMSQK